MRGSAVEFDRVVVNLDRAEINVVIDSNVETAAERACEIILSKAPKAVS